MKKSLEKSKNVLEKTRKNGEATILQKKDTHVYNNCFKISFESSQTKHKPTNVGSTALERQAGSQHQLEGL